MKKRIDITEKLNQTKKTTIKNFVIIMIIILFTVITLTVLNIFLPKQYYNANSFNIKTVYSNVDYDEDLIDDYTDFVLGAREDIKNKPKYVSKYYDNGYPPKNEGVCTDVIWRAFKHAGYSLKDMVDQDIINHPEDYKDATGDKNIDFRRVRNLEVFFKKYATTLTLNLDNYEAWQPGDIVIFGSKHIGIISDKRNEKGIPYLLHNGGQINREEDMLELYILYRPITGHYRW